MKYLHGIRKVLHMDFSYTKQLKVTCSRMRV